MDLKEFIRESLVQISMGIVEANAKLSESNAIVNPAGVQAYSTEAKAYGRVKADFVEKGAVVHLVRFDVALHAESGSEAGGGLKLSIASVGIGGEGKKSESSSTESRIRFEIPMAYPQQE